MAEGGAWGRGVVEGVVAEEGVAAASLRGLPRGRLSAWAGLPVDVAPTLMGGGEGPWSEGSTVLSSDDILKELFRNEIVMNVEINSKTYDRFAALLFSHYGWGRPFCGTLLSVLKP